jgi:hypothetical protein
MTTKAETGRAASAPDRRARAKELEKRKCLIIHGDDLGMSHSINQANFAALKENAITSASLMAPCPWLEEVADFIQENPETDIGLHLTLTSECSGYRWRPLSASAAREGLIDDFGFLHQEVTAVRTKVLHIDEEVGSQFKALKSLGIEATHMDCHMMAAFTPPRLLEGYLRAALTARTVALVPPKFRPLELTPMIRKLVPHINLVRITPSVPSSEWLQFYISAINELPMGINLLTVHLGFDTDELRAIRGDRSGWDASWRQRDFDAITSLLFRDSLAANDIFLTTYREVADAIMSYDACASEEQ